MKKLPLISLFLISFFSFTQSTPEDLENIISSNPELAAYIKNQQELTSDQEITTGQDKSIDSQDDDQLGNKRQSDNNIFGFDFINSIPRSISSTSDLPVPGDYVISLGDKLKIILTGSKNAIYSLQVGMDGNIIFPELGAINVFGNSIKDIRKKIKQLIELSYVGVDVSVSLEALAAKKINIIGAVKNPGTYIVNPFSTITSSLSYSGGFEDYASLRNIVVIREGKSINFDLYEFLILGSRDSDINIQQSDTILIQSTNNLIEIKGAVNRPKIYEYKSDDKYSDLINFALGLKREGDEGNISVIINEDGRKITKKISKNNILGNRNIEALYIGKNVSIVDKGIFVSGSAVTSGYYESSDSNMSEFLKNLNFSSEIYPFYATYQSTISSGLMKKSSAFSLSDPDSYSDLKAINNTDIHFFDRKDLYILNFEEDETEDEEEETEDKKNPINKVSSSDLISISLPGETLSIPIKGKISPRQIHLFLGSSNDIDYEKVSVVTNKASFTDAYEDYFDAEELVAISFPSIQENLIEVEIRGEVINPGNYLVASSTTLSDLYKLAGGLRDEAFEPGIRFFREEIKQKQIRAIREAKSVLTDTMIQKSNSLSAGGVVDIEAILQLADLVEPSGRIAGKFFENSESSDEFLLKDKDSIFIPSRSYEVVVQGEVLNSSSFVFDESMDYKDYINAAGGFSDYADKRAVFVIKANGLSATSGNNIFSGQAKIEPGDTIVVPRNLDQLEALPMISMATKIIADIAFSAASLNAIQD